MILDVVIVTFNRLEKLKITLSCYENQNLGFRNLIIVNNNSSDGTFDYLEEWKEIKTPKFEKKILHLSENKGGAGGFHAGQEYALTLCPDWILVADDDAYPEENLIKRFSEYIEENEKNGIAAVCGTVLNMDGNIDISHRQKMRWKKGIIDTFYVPKEEYNQSTFEIELFSYVGTFLNAEILQKAGCCKPDYFIYYDDTEHSIRMGKFGKIIVVPALKFRHDFGYKTDDSKEKLVSWRHYYACRNYTHMLKTHYGYQGYLFLLIHTLRIIKNYYRNPATMKMLFQGLADGISGNLGIHPIYRPGFTLN